MLCISRLKIWLKQRKCEHLWQDIHNEPARRINGECRGNYVWRMCRKCGKITKEYFHELRW